MPVNRGLLSRLLGLRYEQIAASYLQQQGLTLVEKNYRCREGEIDLIMRDQDTLVFVEVKYRGSASHGEPSAYFHAKKRARVEKAIAQFLHQRGINPANQALRIDLVAIQGKDIEWLTCV